MNRTVRPDVEALQTPDKAGEGRQAKPPGKHLLENILQQVLVGLFD